MTEHLTVGALIRHHAADTPDKPMVVDPKERIAYGDLDEKTRAMASGLVAAGVGKGSRVGLLMPNGTDSVLTALTVTRIGAILVPLSTMLTPTELEAQLRTASVQFLIAVDEFRGRGYPVAPERLPALRQMWTAEQALTMTGEPAWADALAARVRPSDPMVILFTSGSSGPPKGVIHSHGNAVRAVASGLAARCVTADTRLYLPMPFFWVAGFGAGIVTALVAGATLVTEPIPSPQSTLDLLHRERVTLFRGWPDQAEALARHASSTDLSALRPGSLEALLPHELRAQPGARASLFGMTESFGPYCGYPADTDMPRSAWGSCGRPFDGMDIRIVDTTTGHRFGSTRSVRSRSAVRTSCAVSADAVAKRCSRVTGTTPPAISGAWTATGSSSTTADPTTCARSAARPSIPARCNAHCAVSPECAPHTSSTCRTISATASARSWSPTACRRRTCAPRPVRS